MTINTDCATKNEKINQVFHATDDHVMYPIWVRGDFNFDQLKFEDLLHLFADGKTLIEITEAYLNIMQDTAPLVRDVYDKSFHMRYNILVEIFSRVGILGMTNWSGNFFDCGYKYELKNIDSSSGKLMFDVKKIDLRFLMLFVSNFGMDILEGSIKNLKVRKDMNIKEVKNKQGKMPVIFKRLR